MVYEQYAVDWSLIRLNFNMQFRVVVDSWNVGLDFQKDKMSGLVNREEIEAKVKFVMDPTSSVHLREQVHKLRIMAMEAYCGSSNDNLNLFTHFLLQ